MYEPQFICVVYVSYIFEHTHLTKPVVLISICLCAEQMNISVFYYAHSQIQATLKSKSRSKKILFFIYLEAFLIQSTLRASWGLISSVFSSSFIICVAYHIDPDYSNVIHQCKGANLEISDHETPILLLISL